MTRKCSPADPGDIFFIYLFFCKITKISTNNKTYYRLILNGYLVEKYILTSLTERKDALDRIGRMIARRINLNYFDCSDPTGCQNLLEKF